MLCKSVQPLGKTLQRHFWGVETSPGRKEALQLSLKRGWQWRVPDPHRNPISTPNIPGASLEKAVQQEVTDLLIQHYGEDALKVCIRVLQKCSRNDLAKDLEETGQK
ncbi:hypothetical protein L345_17446, partial [Ophiophagus hannah]